MYSFYILLIIILIAIVLLFIEYTVHRKKINTIPIRIHINGTRGKSSVTRLIGAGLREGGIKCITKVTGTFPRLILMDGTETIIHRKASANILEQIAIVSFASKHQADALVMECMALQPQYQTVTEMKMVRSTISVMTNVRLDHVEIMGYTLEEITDTLGRTIPCNKILFSSENIMQNRLKNIADKRKTTSIFVDKESVTTEEMRGFQYIEHHENVALALAVCQHLGIERQTALKGMYNAIPDSGVLKKLCIEVFKKKIYFYNAFAANDPDSTLMIWEKISNENGWEGLKIILLNTRNDRMDRAKQHSELISKFLANEADYVMLIGQSCDFVENMIKTHGFPVHKIINLGYTQPENVFEAILALTKASSSVFAIGNMGGIGADVVSYFEHRSFKS